MGSSFFKILPSRKTLIYHLGQEAGFYSEFNNMVLGILYCYKHNINFILYSKDANFGFLEGWTDFFQPFCLEVNDQFHSDYNIRQNIAIPTNFGFRVRSIMYKLLYHFNFYTYELWPNFHNRNFEREWFVIDNKEMDILEASKYVISKIWKYNKETQLTIDNLKAEAYLPEVYAGMHIRRGDKVVEHQNEKIHKYIEKLQIRTDIKDVFVYTDDYDVICTLRSLYPQYNFYTLVDESEHGYVHQDFIRSSIEFKRKSLLKMFASVDILSRAEYCVGTFSTNPGMFLGMVMPKGKMIGVDFDEWRIW